MAVRKVRLCTIGAAVLALATLLSPAKAQNFFNFFSGFGGYRAPQVRMLPDENVQRAEPRRRARGGGQAYCVRTCDGRYFPITGNDGESRAKTCNSLCPKADTRIVYGSSIDDAATEEGKPYAKLSNAFRYRNELVAGCSCNGKDSGGLARIEPESDPTLRKGDIVAGQNGLVVANNSAGRRTASVRFSPASERIKQRYRPPPVVAKGSN